MADVNQLGDATSDWVFRGCLTNTKALKHASKSHLFCHSLYRHCWHRKGMAPPLTFWPHAATHARRRQCPPSCTGEHRTQDIGPRSRARTCKRGLHCGRPSQNDEHHPISVAPDRWLHARIWPDTL